MLPITYYLVTNNLLKNAILLPITYYFEGIIKEYIREAEEPKRLFGLQYKCFYSLYILTIHIQTSILGGQLIPGAALIPVSVLMMVSASIPRTSVLAPVRLTPDVLVLTILVPALPASLGERETV
jgi:hypothetical protein